jgi:hypothetical protein
MIDQEEDINVLAMSETKLTRNLTFQDWSNLQSTKDRSGCCWIGAKSTKMKKIKALGRNIIWVSILEQLVPINIICCYLEGGIKRNSDETIRRLLHIIDRTKGDLPHSRFMIVGDFNDRLEDITTEMKERGLNPLLPTGTKTHNKGGHLDQCFSNSPCSWEQCWMDITDHSALKIKMEFTKNEQDVTITNIPTKTKQGDMRKEARSEQTIEYMLKLPLVLQDKAIKIYEQRVKIYKTSGHWYTPINACK